ncbi:MAG: C13 family peptidase [Armatimonadota bacterium]
MLSAKRLSIVFAAVIMTVTITSAFAQRNAVQLKLPALRQLPALQNARLRNISALAQVNGQMFGAEPGKLSLIDEQGNITKSVPMNIQKIAGLSGFTPGKLLVGDVASNSVMSVDEKTGAATRLLSLSQVNAQGFPAGSVLKNGELSGVAYDGSNVFVSFKAGFSSSVFKINPSTQTVLEHGWAPGDNPSALTFSNNKLFVLDGKAGQVRPMAPGLKPSYTWIDSNSKNGKGLIIQGNEIKVLTDAAIQRVVTDQSPAAIVPNDMRISIPKNISRDIIKKIMAPQKYALLICGDVAESGAAYNCFWNDTLWMYKMLLEKGFSAENIYVMYGNGVDHNSPNPTYKYSGTVTDFPATIPWVNKVLDGMKNGDAGAGITKVKENDKLFIWTFDHGAGGNPAYLCLMDGWLKDSDFAAKLNAVPYEKRMIFMQQCRSGGFMDELQNNKTFISTACRWDQNAYVADTEAELYNNVWYTHGEYNYYIISALDGNLPTGAAVNADTTNDNRICVREAHNWNVNHENRSEVPQYSDSGNLGISCFLND